MRLDRRGMPEAKGQLGPRVLLVVPEARGRQVLRDLPGLPERLAPKGLRGLLVPPGVQEG